MGALSLPGGQASLLLPGFETPAEKEWGIHDTWSSCIQISVWPLRLDVWWLFKGQMLSKTAKSCTVVLSKTVRGDLPTNWSECKVSMAPVLTNVNYSLLQVYCYGMLICFSAGKFFLLSTLASLLPILWHSFLYLLHSPILSSTFSLLPTSPFSPARLSWCFQLQRENLSVGGRLELDGLWSLFQPKPFCDSAV